MYIHMRLYTRIRMYTHDTNQSHSGDDCLHVRVHSNVNNDCSVIKVREGGEKYVPTQKIFKCFVFFLFLCTHQKHVRRR